MKSWWAICSLIFAVFCLHAEAAPVHETVRLTQAFPISGWTSDLHHEPTDISVAPLAHDEFRHLPQGHVISLEFGPQNRDLFAELITKRSDDAPVQFFYDWVGYIFGLQAWDIGGDPSFYALSGYSRAFIPVPAALPIFFTALAFVCMLLILLKLRKRR